MRNGTCPGDWPGWAATSTPRGPGRDGGLWRVGVQDPANPEDSNALVGILELSDAFAVTSGGYQRYFEEDGQTYHHIIDPSTGPSAESGLTSVTVVADPGRRRRHHV